MGNLKMIFVITNDICTNECIEETNFLEVKLKVEED